MYRTIQDTSDAEALQTDLDKLKQWEHDWLMDFNPSKCEVMSHHHHQLKELHSIYIHHPQ